MSVVRGLRLTLRVLEKIQYMDDDEFLERFQMSKDLIKDMKDGVTRALRRYESESKRTIKYYKPRK